jgi:hypothetical protein
MMRAELTHVLSHVYKSTAPHHRAVRWIKPGGPEHTKAFVKFVDYLGQVRGRGALNVS